MENGFVARVVPDKIDNASKPYERLGSYPTLEEAARALAEMDLTQYLLSGSVTVTEYVNSRAERSYELVGGELKPMSRAFL